MKDLAHTFTPHHSTDTLSHSDHNRVAEFVQNHTGIQLPASKHSLVESRLRKRQRIHRCTTLHDYIHFVLDTPAGETEKIHLLDALTTNKTDFYREAEHFEFLRTHLVHQLTVNASCQSFTQSTADIRHFNRHPFRAWSAGCSSGEEPYTLAIELLEIQRQFPTFRFEILATDISLSCLSSAKKAIYAHDRIEAIPLALRKRYLLRSRNPAAGLVRMADEVKRQVTFEYFNLLTDSFDGKRDFDLILCRNVMIYFCNGDRSALVQRFAHALTAEGLFFLGHSETLGDGTGSLRKIKPTIYSKSRVDKS